MAFGVKQRHLEMSYFATIAINGHRGQFGARIGAFHGCQNTRRRSQMATAGKKIHQARKTAGNNHRKALGGPPIFHAANVHGRIVQAKLDHSLAQERTLLFAGVVQGNAARGLGNGYWNSGQAPARTDVRKCPRALRQIR